MTNISMRSVNVLMVVDDAKQCFPEKSKYSTVFTELSF